MKVALLGASGLVGQVVLERLLRRPDVELVAGVRSPANAWPLIRLGIRPVPAHLMCPDQLIAALGGCSHVVNCAMGDDRELVPTMRNLLDACRQTGVRRLVHLSSVAVYGDPPSPDSTTEGGRTLARSGTYGWYKKQQDDLAASAHNAAMQVAVLCIPHVTGPRSRFLLGLIRQMREGRFAFVDGGRHPVVMADSTNVAHAIELALEADGLDGQRMFVNDGPPVSWLTLVAALAPFADVDPAGFLNLGADEVRRVREQKLGLIEAARRMIATPEVRSIIRQTALFNSRLGSLAKQVVKRGRSGRGPSDRGPVRPSRSGIPPIDLWSQQIRMVAHSCDRARLCIGYTPEVDFAASMAAFRRWYGATYSFDTASWAIAKHI